jgi:ABC-type transport system substrate-binding protein
LLGAGNLILLAFNKQKEAIYENGKDKRWLFTLHTPWAVGSAEETAGTLKIGTQPVSNLDPHFATSIADVLLIEQVYDHLVYIDESNRPVADLATSWESPDGRTWTFNLREGVKFSNGEDLTAEDVVFTFNRLRNPDVGTPVADL